MRTISRFLPLLFIAGLGLGGCSATQDMQDKFTGALHDFNPMGTAKRPLPGERKAMFPEGVPGVQQGIPNELLPGAQTTAATEPPMVAAPAAPTPKTRTRRSRTATTTSPAPRAPRRARRTAPPAAGDPPPDGVWPAPPAPNAQQQAPAPQQPARTAASPPPAAQGWQAPSSQPVPTIWPDPPKGQ